MEKSNEEIVTQILASKEILDAKKSSKYSTNPTYNLGVFLDNYIPEPSPYEGKYVFIK